MTSGLSTNIIQGVSMQAGGAGVSCAGARSADGT